MTTEPKINWTEQQGRAIAARGRNVLVTASAGTGKTAVLSERCVNIVSDAALCPSVLNLLVLTFTEAAAEQMRSRIGRQLRDAFRQTHDPRLNRQLVLLQGADISTIHAFCKRLISENFHELSLDPAFRIIDADEAMLLKAEVLDETIEWAWGQENLTGALRQLLRRRDLRAGGGFLAGVIGLHQFLDGVASRDRWCDRGRRLAEAGDPLATALGQAQKQMVAERLAVILDQLHQAHRLCENETPGGKWGIALQADVVAPVTTCRDRLAAGDWNGCAELINSTEVPRAPALRGFPEETRELIKDLRAGAVKMFTALRDLAVVSPEYMDVVGRSAGAQSGVLIELVRKFSRLYAQRKAALSGLDFADLEHYALRLLTAPDEASETEAKPSETALALRRRYRHIFVDEYQDINPVQQGILDALGSGDNVFVVGDVKQSIYAWRGAEPTIFLEQLHASGQAASSRGLRVDLNRNFRSARGILDFVNKIFGRIMTASLAHIDYDDTARLRSGIAERPGAKSAQDATPIVEWHLLDETVDDTDVAPAEEAGDAGGVDLVRPRQRQAAVIAQRIKEIVGAEPGRAALQIYDKDADGMRDVQYRDIVVLMRSLAKKANDYVEILRLAGIPVSCDATAGYFETTEISDVLSLLKVLDNAQRDIELVAVLRSPFFGFDDSELATIRLAGQELSSRTNFYACATHYRKVGSDLALREKLDRAFTTLEAWRRSARRGHLAELLWHIYRDTQYLAFVCALPNGQARKANLLKLHDRAVQFEGFASSAGVPSLTRFVAFVEKLQEAGQDWTPAEPAGAAGNAVRILSVHRSKGLEFPVVFLAELDSGFNKRDVQADLVMDADNTLGLRIIEPQSNMKLRSLAHQVIGEKRRAMTLAEEMRVLYVALTRAKDRLILTASQRRTDCSKVLRKGLLLGGETLPDWLLETCKNPLEWLLYGLADERVLHEAFATGLVEQANESGLFGLTVYGSDELRGLSQGVQQLRDRKKDRSAGTRGGSGKASEGRQLLAGLKEDLGWQYPFSEAVGQAAKQSVTALTHQDDEFARLDHSRALDRRPLAMAASGPARSASPPARVVGTAVHLVISSLDLTQPVTPDAVERTRDALVAKGAMTPAVGALIDTEAILSFFAGPLGAVVLDAQNTVWSEWPFTLGLPASKADGLVSAADRDAEEIVVVQGIIDMLVETSAGLIVIDFKSDRVSGAELSDRADTYRAQLELYAKAAGAILNRPVRERWLYFLKPQELVAV